MAYRYLTAVWAILGLACALGGCSNTGADPNKPIELTVRGDQWDRIDHGYLNIQTQPADAIVSVQTVSEVYARASIGFSESHETTGTSSHDWQTIGSTPIVNYKVPIAGKARVAPQIGSSMNCRFRLRKLSVRIEKAGYEPLVMDNVVVGHKGGKKLVVALQPLHDVAAVPADSDTYAQSDRK